MKPNPDYCKRYCDLFPCERTKCNRKAVIYPKEIKMEEPNMWNKWRNVELKRAYKETPLTAKEMQTKY